VRCWQGMDKDSCEQQATALCYLITDASQVSDVTGPLAVALASSVAQCAASVGMSLETAQCLGRWAILYGALGHYGCFQALGLGRGSHGTFCRTQVLGCGVPF
jgi:hypothetical protein